MKPIKLEISAFGPYKDKVVIDFSKIGENGIFLITGDTGAGKTSIFDSIVFALYGNVSGDNRPISSVRSDFADVNTLTYVKLWFTHKGKEYTVYRNPQYERPKKNGTGTTTQSADASLERDGKVLASGVKNVDNAVTELLSIDVKQFKQISMLAQGEFLKVLFADSSERTKIFQKIFNTGIYTSITSKLREMNKAAYSDLANTKTRFLTNTRNIKWKEIPLELENIDENNIHNYIKDVISFLEVEVEDNTKELSSAEENVSNLENIIKSKQEIYNNALEINNKILELDNLKNSYSLLTEKENEYSLKQEKIDRSIEIETKVLPKKEKLNEISKELDNLNITLEDLLSEKEELDNNSSSYDLKDKQLKYLKVLLDEFNSLNEDNTKLTNEYELVKKVLDTIYKRNIQAEKYEKVNNEYRELEDSVITAENNFYLEQAGILASKLEDNAPCPVCGSTTHPHIAQVVHGIYKEELDSLKNTLKDKQSIKDEEYNKLVGINKEIELLNNELALDDNKTNLFEHKNGLQAKIEENKGIIDTKLEQINEAYYILTRENRNTLDFDTFNYDEFKENIVKEKEEYTRRKIANETEIKSTKNSIKSKEKDKKKIKVEYVDSYTKLNFNSEEECISSLLDKDTQEEYKEEIQEYNKSIIEINTRVQELEKQVKCKKVTNLKDSINELEELNIKLNSLKEARDNIKVIFENNSEILVKLKENSKEIIDKIDEFSSIEELYKLASGTASGKRKIEFEQYVQATFFDMILIEANKRLDKMTGGRYILVRKENGKMNEKIGLDLEVIDNYTGKRRDVKSLSGGESFKAALSLSLGVSDVIQSYSGGVVVDTLFIDEGFGSLDTESREQAINTLNLLTDNNKLIGIISHVTELKERIEKQIIVEKTSEGSRVKIEV